MPKPTNNAVSAPKEASLHDIDRCQVCSIVKEELRYKAKIVSNEQVRIYSGHIFKFSMSCLLFLLKHRNFVRFESLHQLENKSTQKTVVGFIKGLPPSHLR